ncbi:hypothetical protein Tco_0119774, partial [Tanacetum coccineum]
DGKKGRESNVFYTRFLSLMIENLLGEDYTNNDLTFLKPYTISVASFKKPLAFEVALTSHMLKVAKLLNEPYQTLILSSREVNADDAADNPCPGPMESSLLTQVADTQPAEEPVSIADTTQRESGEVKGHPGPNKESESTLTFPKNLYTLSLHSGDDNDMFLPPDVDSENFRLCQD